MINERSSDSQESRAELRASVDGLTAAVHILQRAVYRAKEGLRHTTELSDSGIAIEENGPALAPTSPDFCDEPVDHAEITAAPKPAMAETVTSEEAHRLAMEDAFAERMLRRK